MAALGRVPCLQPAERGPGQEGPFSPPAPLPVSGLEFPSPGHHPHCLQAEAESPSCIPSLPCGQEKSLPFSYATKLCGQWNTFFASQNNAKGI